MAEPAPQALGGKRLAHRTDESRAERHQRVGQFNQPSRRRAAIAPNGSDRREHLGVLVRGAGELGLGPLKRIRQPRGQAIA
ncbi:hypothetical protein [Phenylobacterium kunshanense]|uniref:hypothetical protein n=1 Tax=Phenylobacterium kunshanense TaxID=1445034 RepID=UPI00105784C1|nr:hypothetical protein [Phenylobacterium kunshanense]